MAAFFGANDIWNRREENVGERVLLSGVWETKELSYDSEEEFEHSLDELGELAKACFMIPVGRITQQLPTANAGLYVGSGKAQEIRLMAEELSAHRVIFNDTLSPSQIRNLQSVLKLPVMDRTALILEIFEERARTREAKLQVELAKLKYLKPRLIGMWETQNRQGGASGALSSKGEGEKQLEIDRRTIDHRLSELSREIKEVAKEREIQKKKRENSGIPLVALIGYTNAGKSTIMNGLLNRYVVGEKETQAENEPNTAKRRVYEADMLFATLDTTVRLITVDRGREFLLSDTVGFIHKLPTTLIEAFRSTLEEVTRASLLLQVVDSSDKHCQEHIEVTMKTLSELGAGHIPMITVYNKADLIDTPPIYPRAGLREEDISGFKNENIYISAKDPSSIAFLAEEILNKLHEGTLLKEFLIPYDKSALVSYLCENAVTENIDYTPEGTLVHAKCRKEVAERVEKMLAI